MEYLGRRSERFISGGEVVEDDLEAILKELKEDGTVATEEETDAESLETSERTQVGEAVDEGLLQAQGVMPNTKQEGVFRLLCENPNGFNNRIKGNEKLEKALGIKDDLDADCLLYPEHRLNLRHSDNTNGFKKMFQRELAVKAVAAHNVHENVGRVQEGGTAAIVFGEATEYAVDKIVDPTGLGRWCGWKLRGREGHATAIITAYNPCKNYKAESGTVYQQHRRYFILQQNDTSCPNKLFRRDLIKCLQQLKGDGLRIVLFMDHNEHVYDDALGRELAKPEGLAMREEVLAFTGERTGATFFRGTRPIDGLWTTGDLDVSNVCVLPFGFGVGDHRLFALDISLESLVGANPVKIVRPLARRLNTRLPHVEEAYNDDLEANIVRHRLLERINEAHVGASSAEEVASKMEKVDKEGRDYMRHAEKICRKIKSCRIPFSPESSIWIRRSKVYRSLLRFHQGKIKNRGNLKRAARRCNIQRPLDLTPAAIVERLRYCQSQCEYYQRYGQKYRRQHLQNRVEAAREREDEEAESKILAIIAREQQRAFWRRLNFVTGKKRTRSVTSLQVEQPDGSIKEVTSQHEVEHAIWQEVHEKRFTLAEGAPICNSPLKEEFGYMANTAAARAVLDGDYTPPPGADEPTIDLFAAVGRVAAEVPRDSTKSIITPEQWKAYWKVQNEETSSSESGLHFGHYKCGTKNDTVSTFHASRVSVVLFHGVALSRWSRGLSVMLEKMLGCTLVSKLRAILLMEADFNASNKIVYGSRMMETVRRHNRMPEEIFSEKGRTADDGSLAKTLFYDVTRQARVPAAIASVDASNCYDRIAHAIASLVSQAFGVPANALESMLGAIQNMKYFLRTGFGDSTDFAGGGVHIKTQGSCQGNGAAPAEWAVISIVILDAHKCKGHGAQFLCPITKLRHHLSAVLYVDDTDLLHINLEHDESLDEVHSKLQSSVNNWGNLLIATGGALKPAKCFYSLISFEWTQGQWKYAPNHLEGDFGVTVPLPDKSRAAIRHMPVDAAEKTLGVMTAVNGSGAASIKLMQEKAQGWINDLRNGHLHRRMVWFSMNVQFWPRVGYGICSSTATFDELAEGLQRQYYQILPLSGVVRTTVKESRMIAPGFFGVGLPHPGVEALAAMANKLLMHYGNASSVGQLMQTSFEFLLLELGMSFQPLQLSYAKYSSWATHSWLKMLWEKLSMFGIETSVNNLPLRFARQGDQFLMQVFEDQGFSPAQLRILNRVRVHQQALFLSCVLSASGGSIEQRYLAPRPPAEMWSTHKWPKEQPTASDFALWEAALQSICPSRRRHSSLGRFCAPSPRRWEWRWCPRSGDLMQRRGDTMAVYRAPGAANRYRLFVASTPYVEKGLVCSVADLGRGFYRLLSHARSPPAPELPETFVDVLHEWGSTWLWEDMQISGGNEWLKAAIEEGTLLAVTDGSYIRQLYPHLCSAAYILECQKGRGRIVGSFAEATLTANAYRGELLGLMAIHLILLSVNRLHPKLTGAAEVVSDCLGALNRVAKLPPQRIPSRCKHSDILKNILVNCSNLSFTLSYTHVKAHQDDDTAFEQLSRKSQLNCMCDHSAKERVRLTGSCPRQSARPFPLEPICMFVNGEKMTSDTSAHIRFWAHRQLARDFFIRRGILSAEQFDEIDWDSVHDTLTSLPRLFQLWASKHVLDIAGTNKFLSYQDGRDTLCPSCQQCEETCSHIVQCREEGRSEAFQQSVDSLEQWMESNTTDPALQQLIISFVRSRGDATCYDIVADLPYRLTPLADSLDTIGWSRLMEGMVPKELLQHQTNYLALSGSLRSPSSWMRGFITCLLETTHAQWIYRNVLVHDRQAGSLISEHKEELQMEIDRQRELGMEGLLLEDQYLLEINLEDLTITNGERVEYWLLAIRAARKACLLSRASNQQQQSTA